MERGVYPLTIHDPIYSFLNTEQPSYPLWIKAAAKHSSHNRARGVFTKEFDFGFPGQGRLSLILLLFSNNCSHFFFLLTKLLANCRLAHYSLVQIDNLLSSKRNLQRCTILPLVSSDSSLVLTMVESLQSLWVLTDAHIIIIITCNRCH